MLNVEVTGPLRGYASDVTRSKLRRLKWRSTRSRVMPSEALPMPIVSLISVELSMPTVNRLFQPGIGE